MSASCYKIVPNRHVFLDFMVTLDLSPEQRHCVETFPIRYVEVDEARNTWKISYDAAATALEQQELAAVAKKVIGVEIVEEAVVAARENAERNGIKNCEFIAYDGTLLPDEDGLD